MSEAARAALISIGTRRQGAGVPPVTDPEVLAELKALGLLGPKGGLTGRGHGRRERIMAEIMMEKMGEEW